jgi:hypothetical protein
VSLRCSQAATNQHNLELAYKKRQRVLPQPIYGTVPPKYLLVPKVVLARKYGTVVTLPM